MEFFHFCLEIINREVKRFNTPFDASGLKTLKFDFANNANYDLIKKRYHFLYRCGTIYLYFAKVCFKTFLLDQKVIEDLQSKWNKCSDLTLCSIGTGPALDYVALLYSFQESGIVPPLFKNIKVVTKHGAWRNTTNIMHEIMREGVLKSLGSVPVGNIKVIQGDPLKDFAQKIKSAVSNSNVIMMMKSLNIQGGYNQKKISESLQVFLDVLKPGTVLFCIDNKQSIKEITGVLNLFPGRFLLKPTSLNTTVNFDSPRVIEEHVGCLPILSAEGIFFVWEKYQITQRESTVNDISESFKWRLNIDDVTEKKDYNSQNADGCSLEYLNRPSTSSQKASDMCIQTEPDEILQETEEKKIMELTHRIENLTAELAQFLENNESRFCMNNYCCEKVESASKRLDSNDICDQSPSKISCSSFSDSNQNCGKNCGHCQAFSQCRACNHAKMKASNCDFEASSFNNLPINHNVINSTENNPSLSAQLVIPLRNLSADTISQIVSLISQTEQK